MMSKVVWQVLSCLMVAALMLASCTSAITEEEVVQSKEEDVIPMPNIIFLNGQVITMDPDLPGDSRRGVTFTHA